MLILFLPDWVADALSEGDVVGSVESSTAATVSHSLMEWCCMCVDGVESRDGSSMLMYVYS